VKVYANAGCTMDLSGGVTDRCLFHVDNAYFIPNVRARAWMCKTNLPTNTAFRGFGGPQAMMLAETYIGHIAQTLNMHPHQIRVRFHHL
jgi:xanthine dehydrogenase/oxidase